MTKKKSITAYVVTDSELGWDCVVAVFDNEEAAEACVEDRGEYSHVAAHTMTSTYEEW